MILGSLGLDGDPIAPYRTHRQITDFFDETSVPETARVLGGSREDRVSFTLKALNGTPTFSQLVRAAFHPGHFSGIDQLNRALTTFNEKVQFDQLRVEVVGGAVVLSSVTGVAVEVGPSESEDPLSDEYVQLLIRRAEHRLASGEADGAITTARTLLENVLHAIQQDLLGARDSFGGDLVKLYKSVAKEMRLDDQRADLDERYRSILRGMTSIVGALAPISNASGDRHAPTRLPAPHHARLCVNAAKSVVVFLRDSLQVQRSLGLLPERRRVPLADECPPRRR